MVIVVAEGMDRGIRLNDDDRDTVDKGGSGDAMIFVLRRPAFFFIFLAITEADPGFFLRGFLVLRVSTRSPHPPPHPWWGRREKNVFSDL